LQVLDIGTGYGKLPELLLAAHPQVLLTGTDISGAMIAAAQKRVQHPAATFVQQQPGKPLPFAPASFDLVALCSVLFLLDGDERDFLAQEALRVLKPGGHLLVLTPTGSQCIGRGLLDSRRFPASRENWTFAVWNAVTARRAKHWQQQHWLSSFSTKNDVRHQGETVFNGYAVLETVIKPFF
jgi:ubiquinone/menaquinone biosynthesis C-methylase UbiE